MDGNEFNNTNGQPYGSNRNGAQTYTPTGFSQGVNTPNYPPKKNGGKGPIVILCVILSFIAGLLGGYVTNTLIPKTGVSSGDTVMYKSVIREVSREEDADEAMSISEVSSYVANSVVEISTEYTTTSTWMTQYVYKGAGSGVILSEDGYIVTNNHVIENATKITVKLHSGDEYEAQLIATDPQTDIAVIKINATDLSAAVLGNSSALTQGDQIVLVGNPLGALGGSVSEGIISALDRDITVNNQTMVLLQTDAAVNPGNSGGGMFNMYGELIGIVNAKSEGSDIDNIGFAIPIDTAKNVIEQLLSYGYVQNRPYLGLTMIDINDRSTATSYRVSEYGVYVLKAASSSNAAKAGVKSGDRIISVNGTEVSSTSDVNTIINAMSVGDEVTLQLSRSGSKISVTFSLDEMKASN